MSEVDRTAANNAKSSNQDITQPFDPQAITLAQLPDEDENTVAKLIVNKIIPETESNPPVSPDLSEGESRQTSSHTTQ